MGQPSLTQHRLCEQVRRADIGSMQPVDLGDGHGFGLSVNAGAVYEGVDRTDVEMQLLA
jgi:hypothetical protein